MSQKTMINDLTTGSVTKQLITFATPFILSNLLQTLYAIVDMVIVGQFVGKAGLSGVSIGSDILFLITNICMGFASAGQVIISQFVGNKDNEAIKKTIGTMFTVILIGSVLITLAGFIAIKPLLAIMNTPPEAYDQAYSFTLICFVGTVFIFGYNTVSAVLRGMGDSKRPFVFITLALITTIILDLIFVAGLGMGAGGAALATIIGQGVSFVGSIVYLYIHREAFGFDFKLKSFAVDGSKLKLLFRLGMPMVLQYCAITISMMFVGASINSYGVVASAVTGIGNKLRSVMAIFTSSICIAGATMIGQNLGAGKLDRVTKIVRITLVIGISAAIVFSGIALAFPKQIFTAFSSEAEVQGMAFLYMGSLAVSFLSFALMAPYNAVLNGLGHASLGLFIGIMDGVVARIGLSLLLGVTFKMGVMGFWYGNAFAGYVTVIIGAAYYYSGRWRKRKLLIQN